MSLRRRGILARAGWFKYGDREEYKCPLELAKAVELVPSLPIVAAHPADMFVSDAEDVIGTMALTWDPRLQAITTDEFYFPHKLTVQQEQRIRGNEVLGESAGFTCTLVPYGHGHLQKDILLNHAAVLFDDEPRCPIGQCGSGVLDHKRVDWRVSPATYEVLPVKSAKVKRQQGDRETLIESPKGDKILSENPSETQTTDSTPPEPKLDELAKLRKQLQELQAKVDQTSSVVLPLEQQVRQDLLKAGLTEDQLEGKDYAQLVEMRKIVDQVRPKASSRGDTVTPPVAPTQQPSQFPGMTQLPGGVTVVEYRRPTNKTYKYKHLVHPTTLGPDQGGAA